MRRALSLAACLSIVAVPAGAAAQVKQGKPKKTQPGVPSAQLPGATKPSTTQGGSTGEIAPPATMPTLKLPPPEGLPAPLLNSLRPGAAALTIPFRTTTSPLGAVGRGHEVTAESFRPVRIRTGTLGAVGNGAAPAPASFSPVRVRTAPMGAIGRSSGG